MTELVAAFRARYGTEPRVFRAPGRVNLIGEHTDYNGGYVFPAAIDRATYVAMAPRGDGRLRAASLALPETLDVPVGHTTVSGNWTDFVLGVSVLLGRTEGADLLYATDVPIGGGLSSSAALSVSTAFALGTGTRTRAEIARLCQRAENEFTGMQCGIMDPLSSCLGEEGKALLIDCRDLSYEAVAIPEGVRLVIANTMVKHELGGTEYNDRRAACEMAAAKLDMPYLRDVEYAGLEGAELRCARHVITENARVQEFAAALRGGDMAAAGRAMYASHESLRVDFAVSCAELDTMVSIARGIPGVYGARMTGGGFGGCTINLVAAERAGEVVAALEAGYERATGIRPHIFETRAAAGAGEVAV